MSAAEREAAPTPIAMDVVTDAVVALIGDQAAAGRVVVLRSVNDDEPPWGGS